MIVRTDLMVMVRRRGAREREWRRFLEHFPVSGSIV